MKNTRLMGALTLFVTVILASIIGLPGVQAQGQLSVTVFITNDGEYTVVTGVVMDLDQNPVEGAAVSIQAVDSAERTVHLELTYTDQNGQFTDKFKAPDGVSGEGTIYVSASKTGYENGGAQAAFTAIPEFQAALTAAMLPLLLALLLMGRRRHS